MKKVTLFLAFLLFAVGMALAQQKTFSGVVISSEDGKPVIGASVVAKGFPGVGAQTDLDGKFSFSGPASVKTLMISYIGMKTVEVPASANMKITLAPEAKALEGIVVTGMGVKRSQKSLGYSVQQVKSDDLKTTRTTDLNNALAGKISGARFIGGSGATFDAGSIVLRGTSSLSPGGSEPIYVVDGVITNKNMVNMDDVVSLNVLKGPAATAVYGSEGGNGAIIITTRGGTASGGGSAVQTVVDFSHTTTFEKPVNYFDFQQEYGGGYMGADAEMPIYKWKEGHNPQWKVLDGQRFYDYANDASWGPKFDGKPYIPFYAWDTTDPRFGQTALWQAHGKDNILELFRTGITNTTNIGFGRASQDHMTRVSFTNVSRRGMAYNSDAVRRFLSVKTSFRPMEHMTVDLDYKYTYRENHNAANEEYGGFNPVYSFTQWGHTNVNIKDLKENYVRPDGSFRTWNIRKPTDLSPAYHNNPFALMNEVNKYSRYSWNVFSTNATYEITDKIKATASLFGNLRNYMSETKVGFGLSGDDVIPYYGQEQNRIIDVRAQGKVAYSDRFWEDQLTLDAAVYVEDRTNRYDRLIGKTTDGLTDLRFNFGASNGKPLAENFTSKYHTRSLFGTLTLGLKNTYYADFSARNDWSSTLPDKNNSYFFGGVSLAAIASNLIERNPVLNFWKIRASLAQVGSTMNPYNVYQTYETGKYGSTTWARNIRTLNDPEIRPTISTSYEVGTEFRMFNNRFWGDINFYSRVAKDQIINLNNAPASGFSTRKVNAGKIRNRGIEISLGGSPVKTNDWQWDVNFNFAKNVNKLLELDGIRQDYRVSWMSFSSRASLYAIVGKPVGTILANDWKYDDLGRQVFRKRTEKDEKGKIKGIENGEYDLVTNQVAHEIGNVQPDFTGGFSTSLRWKNLTFRTSLDFQIGGNILSVSNMFGEGSGLLSSTIGKNARGGDVRAPLDQDGGVHVVGVDTEGNRVDSYIEASYYFNSAKSSLWGPYCYDATYVKMRELAISYEFPKSLLDKTGFLKGASIAFVANNPWLIYSGVPNLDVSEAINSFGGYMEVGQTLSSRTFGFTVNLTF
ncbi:SusC/RagA family TonB-linked outer membrane protein [Porphyromonas macacae]|uniref:SusC/RagA family TonB-linked outer membrane protein n=1 Tax=Porphyromonas macacae TaxID=28115 RepID=UPI0035A04669